MKRRVRAVEHSSRFTDDVNKVKESKNIYLLDKDLIDEIVKKKLLDAWIDILVDYGNKYVNGEKLWNLHRSNKRRMK